jgi:DNA repair photolyase
MNEIGITERGDAALDLGWVPWVREGNPAILITKNPQELLFNLMGFGLESFKFNIIVHATITGLGGSLFEPNVPNKKDSIEEGYKGLINLLSINRVVLRIDPVIPTEEGIRIAKSVLDFKNPRGRVRISFIDQYPHTKARMKAAGVSLPWNTFHAPLKARQEAFEELGRPEICGEPDFACTGCISEQDCKTLGVAPEDMGHQRKFCACLMNKKELLNSKQPCSHKCVYCYWGKK